MCDNAMHTPSHNRDKLDTSLKQGEEYVKEFTQEAQEQIKQGREQLRKIVSEIDKKAHENPWPIVGGVAIGCVLIGFLLGSRRGH